MNEFKHRSVFRPNVFGSLYIPDFCLGLAIPAILLIMP